MKEYTIKEISNMLNVSGACVKRWIDNGKLKATYTSVSKTKYRILEYDLIVFVQNNKKYKISESANISDYGAILQKTINKSDSIKENEDLNTLITLKINLEEVKHQYIDAGLAVLKNIISSTGSQRKAAEILNIDTAIISKIISGDIIMSENVYNQICKYYKNENKSVELFYTLIFYPV